MDYIFIIVGFALLIKGADYMVDGASSLAKRFGISDLVIGLTVVAFGTSAPELVTSLMSALNGNADISISNVLGSNISNILLILGITALVLPIKAPKNTFFKEIPFMLASSILFLLLALYETEQTITRADGLIFIMFFSIFIYYIFRQATKTSKIKINSEETETIEIMQTRKASVYTLGGLIGLVIGGKFIVDGAVGIAESLGIPNAFIGVTIVALGTSLPELASSIVAALKKNTDMAIGGIVGSNIFNILWILGITATITPLKGYHGMNIDAYFGVFITFLLIILLLFGKQKFTLSRIDGGILTGLYFLYIGYLIYTII